MIGCEEPPEVSYPNDGRIHTGKVRHQYGVLLPGDREARCTVECDFSSLMRLRDAVDGAVINHDVWVRRVNPIHQIEIV